MRSCLRSHSKGKSLCSRSKAEKTLVVFITLIVKWKSTLKYKNGYSTLSNRGRTQGTDKRDSFVFFLATWLFVFSVVLMEVPD